MQDKKILAIIPARGGSKRIPRKNIKDFLGKPIIAYSIETAVKSRLFDEVMVSTDDRAIAKVAKKYGAKVPFVRSTSNSNSQATLADVVLEINNCYKKKNIFFSYMCCILPTAVMTTEKHLLEAYRKLINQNFYSVIPVIKYPHPIQRSLEDREGMLKMREPEYAQTRTQDLKPYYFDSGQFYWLKTKKFLEEKSFFMTKTGYMQLSEEEVQDVDVIMDWRILEMKYKLKFKL